jgi:hypothetical protein
MRTRISFLASICALALVLLTATAATAQIAGLYYVEVPKPEENRVYVFNTPERFHAWEQSHDMGTAVTLVGAGEHGETIVAENETALDLYNFRHNLPAYERPTPKPAVPAPFPASKFGIRVYADFSNKKNLDEGTGIKSADSGNGFDVKRTYFTFTHSFDPIWSAQFQSDIGDQGAKRYDVFVKKAFIEAKISPLADFRLGSDDLPWIPFVENVYGYRYIETTLTDHLSFGTSADWGLHFGGITNLVSYKVSVINGKGYSNPSRSQSVDFEGRVALTPLAGLTLAAGAYSGKRGLETDTTPARHTAQKVMALAAYAHGPFRIGGEWFEAKNWNNVLTIPSDKANGYSTWASFTLNPQWAFFGRYDDADPSRTLKPKLNWNYYNLGTQWTLNKAFQASLVWKHADAKGGTVGTSNGTIGSTVPGATGKYDEIGVFTVYNF